MAFEKLFECTDLLFEKYKKLDDASNFKASQAVLDSAVIYYQTVLQMAKFKSQRDHFEKRLFECNKGYYMGYFKKECPGGKKLKVSI